MGLILVRFRNAYCQESEDKIWLGGYDYDHYVYMVEKGDADKFLGGAFLVGTPKLTSKSIECLNECA